MPVCHCGGSVQNQQGPIWCRPRAEVLVGVRATGSPEAVPASLGGGAGGGGGGHNLESLGLCLSPLTTHSPAADRRPDCCFSLCLLLLRLLLTLEPTYQSCPRNRYSNFLDLCLFMNRFHLFCNFFYGCS